MNNGYNTDNKKTIRMMIIRKIIIIAVIMIIIIRIGRIIIIIGTI